MPQVNDTVHSKSYAHHMGTFQGVKSHFTSSPANIMELVAELEAGGTTPMGQVCP